MVTPLVGDNGDMSPSTPQTVYHGATTSFIITPDNNYHIDTVIGCDGTLVGNIYTTGPVTVDCRVISNFSIDTYVLAYSVIANGTITGLTTQIVSSGSDGEEVTAVPADNYQFFKWSDGSLDNPRTDMNVTEDITVAATFARIFNWPIFMPAIIGMGKE